MYCKSRIHHLGWLIPFPTNPKPFALALLLPKLQFRFSGASSEQSSQDPCEWDAFASCDQWWHCQTAQECASSRCLKAGARFVSDMFCWVVDLPFLAHGEILQICMYPRYWKLRGKAVWQMHGTGGAGVWQADRVWWHLLGEMAFQRKYGTKKSYHLAIADARAVVI